MPKKHHPINCRIKRGVYIMSTEKKMVHYRKPVDDEMMLVDFQIYHTKKHFYAILFMATLQKKQLNKSYY